MIKLYGSEKQVKWATDIINDLEQTANTMIDNGRNAVKDGKMPADMFAKIESAINGYLQHATDEYTHASDVINDREMFVIRLNKAISKAIA